MMDEAEEPDEGKVTLCNVIKNADNTLTETSDKTGFFACVLHHIGYKTASEVTLILFRILSKQYFATKIYNTDNKQDTILTKDIHIYFSTDLFAD